MDEEKGVQIAELVQNHFEEDIQTQDIDDVIVDYVLRCTKGPYAGNFVYLNITEEGERIGSDPSKDITLTIENAGLSPYHCSIIYEKDERSHYNYVLRDMKSEKGTWVKIGADIPIVIKPNMVFKIDQEVYQVDFSENPIDEVNQWLGRAELKCLIQKFNKLKIKTLDDIKELAKDSERLYQITNQQERQKFFLAFEDIENDFPDKYIKNTLQIRSLDNNQIQYQVGWAGSYIDSKNRQDDSENENSEDEKLELYIKYTYGKYWFMLCNQGNAYIRLDSDDFYALKPDGVIQLGSLEFTCQRFNTGIYQDQGDRRTMEDAVICVQDIGISFDCHVSFFSVFDGHGGDSCVKFVSSQIVQTLKNVVSEDNYIDKSPSFYRYMYDVLQETIQQTDLDFFEKNNNFQKKCSDSGSVACIVLIVGNILLCANIGDCRGIISRQGKAINISKDHKPYDENERRRVNEAKGYVELNRVNGRLGVSRAFGDFRFKKEENFESDIVSVEPEIRHLKLDYMTDEFLIIACDGLFDVFSSQQCVDFVRSKLLESPLCEQDPQQIAKLLVKEVLSKGKARKSDNTSVVIVTLTRGIPNISQAEFKSEDENQNYDEEDEEDQDE